MDKVIFSVLNLQNALAEAPIPPPGGAGAPVSAPAGAGQAAQPIAGGQAPQQSPMTMMLWMAVIFGVFYFFMIRPQQKRAKEQQKLISALQVGDEVLTTSGIIGKIAGIADKVVTIEIATNVKIKVLKSQVNQVIKDQIKEPERV